MLIGIGDGIRIVDILAIEPVAAFDMRNRIVGQVEPKVTVDVERRLLFAASTDILLPCAEARDRELMQRPIGSQRCVRIGLQKGTGVLRAAVLRRFRVDRLRHGGAQHEGADVDAFRLLI